MPQQTKAGTKAGYDVRVPWSHLEEVTRRVPALQELIDIAMAKDEG